MSRSKKEAIATSTNPLERLLAQGDLSSLTSEQRSDYYIALCESLNLNPLTRPFEFINFDGRVQLYAKKDCTEQLRKMHKISIQITDRSNHGDLFFVTARATMPIEPMVERQDESIGAVSLLNLKGKDAANAIMRAETKAKRRVTLSICGLGILDESELESVPNVRPVEDTLPKQEKRLVVEALALPVTVSESAAKLQELVAPAEPCAVQAEVPIADRVGAFNEEPPEEEDAYRVVDIPRPPQAGLYEQEKKILKDALAELVKVGVYQSKPEAWTAFKSEFKTDGFDSLTVEQYQPILGALRLKWVNRPPSRSEIRNLIDRLRALAKIGVYPDEVSATEDLRSVFDGKTIDQMSRKEVLEATEIIKNKMPVAKAGPEDDSPF